MEYFFDESVANGNYEQHMLEFVDGANQYYEQVAKLVFANNPNTLLDLGCGTGLQLEPIFQKLPNLVVTGIDLSKNMLSVLQAKFAKKKLILIHASYFDTNLGKNNFDIAISVMSLHHFNPPLKQKLYHKVYDSLKAGGKYIEADYMVNTQQEEDFYASEKKRLRLENHILDTVLDNYDSPCTVKNQIKLLKISGFSKVCDSWNFKNTHILIAEK